MRSVHSSQRVAGQNRLPGMADLLPAERTEVKEVNTWPTWVGGRFLLNETRGGAVYCSCGRHRGLRGDGLEVCDTVSGENGIKLFSSFRSGRAAHLL